MTNQLALQEFNGKKNKHLFISIVLDVLGMLTYLLPFLGEFGDIIFAPFYGLAIFIMYRKRIFSASVGGFAGMVEELLPGFDIIPTATLMWAYTYIMKKDRTLSAFVNEKNKEIDAMNNINRLH